MKTQDLGGLIVCELTMDFDATKPVKHKYPVLETASNAMKSKRQSR
jgi:hypothetical protein